ncbi:MAG: hypothetical protein NVSMB64_15700 [Candidatus Velthaea sp.]
MKKPWIEPRRLDENPESIGPWVGLEPLANFFIKTAIIIFTVLMIGVVITLMLGERNAIAADAARTEERDKAIILLPKQIDLIEKQIRVLENRITAIKSAKSAKTKSKYAKPASNARTSLELGPQRSHVDQAEDHGVR